MLGRQDPAPTADRTARLQWWGWQRWSAAGPGRLHQSEVRRFAASSESGWRQCLAARPPAQPRPRQSCWARSACNGRDRAVVEAAHPSRTFGSRRPGSSRTTRDPAGALPHPPASSGLQRPASPSKDQTNSLGAAKQNYFPPHPPMDVPDDASNFRTSQPPSPFQQNSTGPILSIPTGRGGSFVASMKVDRKYACLQIDGCHTARGVLASPAPTLPIPSARRGVDAMELRACRFCKAFCLTAFRAGCAPPVPPPAPPPPCGTPCTFPGLQRQRNASS